MLEFTKMHGLGNDYVFIYDEKEKITDLSKLSRTLSNRNIGIGSDGLIVISKSKIADFKMRILNSDGSKANMCGNGIRCVAKYVYDKKLTNKTNLKIETLSGVKEVSILLSNKKVIAISVNMGECKFLDSLNLDICGSKFRVDIYDIGNLHGVIFTSDYISSKYLARYGELISKDMQIMRKCNGPINIEFVKVVDKNNIVVSVFERGSGITLACGTGSSASYFAAFKKGYVEKIGKVKLKYGNLIMNVKENDEIIMTGEAITVYDGLYYD